MAETSPRIVTERLFLRLATLDDILAILRFYAENAAHLAPTAPPQPPDFLTETFWRRTVEHNRREFDAGRSARFFVFAKAEPDRVIGTVGLNNIVRGAAHFCDLGYALAADRQGQGYMGEAVAAAIRYAFDELRLHRIKAAYLPSNDRSGRLLRRLGFAVDGYARDYLLIDGHWQDQVLVGLVNDAWRPDGAGRTQPAVSPPPRSGEGSGVGAVADP